MGTNKRIEILKEISNKGGLLARCARMYLDDEVMGHKFIFECSEQCHIEFTTEYFGKELVSDILKYCDSKKTEVSVCHES